MSKAKKKKYNIATPYNLSSRNQWLRDYYFLGQKREWNNEYMPFSTGLPGDRQFSETDYYIVPEFYFYFGTNSRGIYETSVRLMAQNVEDLPEGFFDYSLPERRMIFFENVVLNHIPQEIIGPELLAGGRFNTQLSKCLNKEEQKKFEKRNLKNRKAVVFYHNHGFGNTGATGGHLIPDYKTVIEKGFKFLYNKAKNHYSDLSEKEKKGAKGAELRAIIHATEIPRKLAKKYSEECKRLIEETSDEKRKNELEQMAKNLKNVPWEPAKTFWEGVQSLWITHMLVMAEESYPGPGVSFGRTDQHLYELYRQDVLENKSITKEFAKDILGSFWFHCNTAYDAQIRIGNQGITAGFGQLMTLSGCGPNGEDLTNELTYTMLEVIDEWSPILEPKPNVRLHRNSPDKLLNILVNMITRAQGAPFLLNFDERSIAGLELENIPKDKNKLWDYACVGCLENTLQGNDRSGTVNCNPNLVKSILLALSNGKSPNFNQNVIDLHPKEAKSKTVAPKTGKIENFTSWDQFFNAWKEQIKHHIKFTVDVYNKTEKFRSDFMPTPYLSSLVQGCIEKGLDIRSGGPEIRYITIQGVGFATLVDSLLAIKKYVFEDKKYTLREIKDAMDKNFKGKKEWVIMKSLLKNKTPKYGNDEEEADELARKIMKIWAEETYKFHTPTNFNFRPGMLSWNYWAGEDAAFTPATPNGRESGTFLSNAISPTNGADTKGPTAVTNSVGNVLGGKDKDGNYINYLPNGSSHTLTFNPSLLKDPESKEKFKAYLKGYIENGGTSLQVNILDANMLKDAQLNPDNYQNLLVRITGYNAYFTTIGKELQDEIIAREMHSM